MGGDKWIKGLGPNHHPRSPDPAASLHSHTSTGPGTSAIRTRTNTNLPYRPWPWAEWDTHALSARIGRHVLADDQLCQLARDVVSGPRQKKSQKRNLGLVQGVLFWVSLRVWPGGGWPSLWARMTGLEKREREKEREIREGGRAAGQGTAQPSCIGSPDMRGCMAFQSSFTSRS